MMEVKEKFTGYNRPDWEKYIAMLQMILYYAGRELYKMALIKIAFYADFAGIKKMSDLLPDGRMRQLNMALFLMNGKPYSPGRGKRIFKKPSG